MDRVFLDHNATTPLAPQVWQAMGEVAADPLNASSVHGFGRQAHSIVEGARREVAALVNGKNKRVVFTSCGTEANNLALGGLGEGVTKLVSAAEHASVLKTRDVQLIPVDADGVVDLVALERMLANIQGKVLVSVMLANNETGVIQPVADVARIAHQYGALMHTDAVQAVGKIEVDIEQLGVDMMTLSAHKINGPQGAAALIVNKSLQLVPLLNGGSQEQGFRAGTQNVAAIQGFGVAAKLAAQRLKTAHDIATLRDKLESNIKVHAPQAVIFGSNVPRLGNTSYVSMPGVDAQMQLIHFDLLGIAVSSGAACSSGKVETSHVLQAMGVEKNIAQTALRISLGSETTIEEVDYFLKGWTQLYDRSHDKHNQEKAA